jgi:hypothetical protein
LTPKLEEISSFSKDNFTNSMKFQTDLLKSMKLSLSKSKERTSNGSGMLSKISQKKWIELTLSKILMLMPTLVEKFSKEKLWTQKDFTVLDTSELEQ